MLHRCRKYATPDTLPHDPLRCFTQNENCGLTELYATVLTTAQVDIYTLFAKHLYLECHKTHNSSQSRLNNGGGATLGILVYVKDSMFGVSHCLLSIIEISATLLFVPSLICWDCLLQYIAE